MTRPTSRTLTFLLVPLATLGLALTCAFVDVGVAQAADQKAVLAKIKAHYQAAAAAYDDGELDKTQGELQQALKLAEENGLGGHKLVAQVYVLYGVLEVAGLKDKGQGVKYFAKALDISPAIQVPPTMASKAVLAAFDRAENQESEPAAAPAAQAAPDETEEALLKPAAPTKPTRAAKAEPPPRSEPSEAIREREAGRRSGRRQGEREPAAGGEGPAAEGEAGAGQGAGQHQGARAAAGQGEGRHRQAARRRRKGATPAAHEREAGPATSSSPTPRRSF